LQADITVASETGQVQRLNELGTLYGQLESQLHQQLDQWAELAA
jgi:hypothetical protein